MTVLNDKQIRALCEYPRAHVRVGYKAGFHSSEVRVPVYLEAGKAFDQLVTEAIASVRGSVGGGITALHDEKDWLKYKANFKPMIEPYVPGQMKTRNDLVKSATDGIENDEYAETKIISYGTSSFGYDLRLGHKFKVFTNMKASVVDPKNFDNDSFVEVFVERIGDWVIIPPNSFILGYSLEYVRMPDDVVGVVIGKSTIARMGINCLATPLEPGWEGHVTLEFTNGTPLPARMYVGEGCCQVMFHKGERPMVTYGDRGGKYQNQPAEPIVSKV